MPREPVLSVVLPVYDGAATLDASLRALRASRFRDFELIVVDDASRDGSGAIAERFAPDVLLRNATNQGHTAARNRGVAVSRGRVLFFTDADVCIAPDTLERVASWFEDPAVECVVGLYEPLQPHASLASAYKNAWIHHSYARSSDEIDWFFTAVGAVRREAFLRVGGFVPRFRREGGGGDVDFGRRLHTCGVHIHLDKSLRVTHHRRFTVRSLLGNDYRRAAGWTRMIQGRPGGLRQAANQGVANVSRSFAAGSLLALGSVLALPLALVSTPVLVALGAALTVQLFWDSTFLRFAWRTFGPVRAVGFAVLGLLDRLACGAGMVAGAAGALRDRLRTLPATADTLPSADDRSPR